VRGLHQNLCNAAAAFGTGLNQKLSLYEAYLQDAKLVHIARSPVRTVDNCTHSFDDPEGRSGLTAPDAERFAPTGRDDAIGGLSLLT
jgi:hypothetical protein